jgi:hypothetical protein
VFYLKVSNLNQNEKLNEDIVEIYFQIELNHSKLVNDLSLEESALFDRLICSRNVYILKSCHNRVTIHLLNKNIQFNNS